jgi:geranylgeranyl pyrophosphate synthase
MLSSHELTNEDILEAASIARRYQTPQSSMDLARSHSNKAIDALQVFPESPSRQILQEIADDVVAW